MRKFMRTRAPDAPPSPPPSPPRAPSRAPHRAPRANGHAGGMTSRGYAASCAEPPSSSLSGAPLFEDAEFCGARALGDTRLARRVHWPRPHELCATPRFRGDGAGGEEAARWVAPGGVGGVSGAGGAGSAALCGAAAALAQLPRLMDRVVPPQSFRDHYSGEFRFRLWVFGEWREVVVDDRLPARGARLLAARAAPDDFTLPLLEKAYAKLLGSYAALRGAGAAGALAALSGGVVQSVALRGQERARTLQLLQAAVPRATLLLCAPAACVTGLARAPPATLVRVRAAGGRGAWRGAWAPGGAEWRSAWAPGGAEWRALAPADRDLLADDPAAGFWMSFEEFTRVFSQLELVHVGPDDWLLEPALQSRRPWRAVLARRRWRPGLNAGGPPSCATAGANPQFHLQIPGAAKCHVVVSVTQQCAPAPRRLHAVGFALYALGAGDAASARRSPAELRALRPLDVTHESRAREVVAFFTLPPGRYLLVPHTRRPHTPAAFLLRVLTDEPADVWEVNDDNMIVRDAPAEFLQDERAVPGCARAAAARAARGAAELDAAALRAALRREWRAWLCARPSLALCRALVALRDTALAGALAARELPALLALLGYWRAAFLRAGGVRRCGGAHASSYRLRALLWAAGVTASNKVLECLVLRFARGRRLSEEAYVMALARLHLAHERYRSLDVKLKCNPLSLEEMILMTIYS